MLWAVDLHNTLLRPADPQLWEAAFGDVLAPLSPDVRRRVCCGLPELMAVSPGLDASLLDAVADHLLRTATGAQAAAKALGLPPPTRRNLELARRMRRFHDDSLTLFADAASFLKRLHASGQRGVFCSETPVPLGHVLAREGLSGMPAVYSCEAGARKADGGLFAALQRRFGAQPMVVVGDSWNSDGLGARAAGAMAQIVRRHPDDPLRWLSRDLSALVEARGDGVRLGAKAANALAPLCPNKAPPTPDSLIRHADGRVSLREWTGITVVESLDMLTFDVARVRC